MADQVGLPTDFNQRVLDEQKRLAVENNDPVVIIGRGGNQSLAPNADLSKYKQQAETNMASQHINNSDMQKDKELNDSSQLMIKTKADNEIRKKVGLPEIPMPQQSLEVKQPDPNMFQPQAQQSPQIPQDPYGSQAFMDAYQKGLDKQHSGINKEAAALGEQGQLSSEMLEGHAKKLNDLNSQYESHHQALNDERASLMKDAIAGHIDANAFWENKSLPGKISTALGLILGGMGAAGSGQENLAAKFLNSQIDNNMEAQKLNNQNKFSLLNMNREQFQNEKDATDMTRVMLNDQVSNQLKLAAAKTADPLAKARALQTAGQLDMQSAPVVSQIAARKAMLGGMKNGTIDPAAIIRFSGIVPENEKESVFKELQAAQNMAKSRDNLLSSWEMVNKLNTVGNRAMSPLQSSSLIKTFEANIGQLAHDSEGRVTSADVGYLKTLAPMITDNANSRTIKKNKFNAFISEKMNFPRLRSIGIDASNMGRFDTGGQNKIQESAPQLGSTVKKYGR